MYHYAGNNPVKYVDPDGRYTWTQFKADVAPSINFDFGYDYTQLAGQYWNNGQYLQAALLEADAACEMVYDLIGCYVGSKLIGTITSSLVGSGNVASNLVNTVDRVATRTSGQPVSSSSNYTLVYGASGKGQLRDLSNKVGSKLLQDIGSPYESGFANWIDFSKATLNRVSASGGKILFDLTNIDDVNDALKGIGPYAQTVTSQELRYIMQNWENFKDSVDFCKNGVLTEVPW